jgi:ubiquinone/menaquinone biosynthesis C-methylase UbiE
MNEKNDPIQTSSQSMVEFFNQVYASLEKIPLLRKIFQRAYGNDCPPAEAAGFNFLSLSELRCISQELHVGIGETFADLACGTGGPGLWIARETGANLVGIDFSSEAVRLAEQNAARWGLKDRASYQLADMAATGLPAAAFDGALSIDAVQIAADKQAFLCEVARILKNGGRFAFTTWEDKPTEVEQESEVEEKITNFRPLLKEAGFEVVSCIESPGWEGRQREVYQETLAYAEEIQKKAGEQTASGLFEEAKYMTELQAGRDRLSQLRRILVIAAKIRP